MEIVLRIGPPEPVEEVLFSRSFCRRYLEAFSTTDRIFEVSPKDVSTVDDLRKVAQAETLLVINEDELLVTPHVFCLLPPLLADGPFCALMPALSPARFDAQRAPLPYPYHTVRTFLETADILAETRPARPKSLRSPAECPCVLLHTRAFENLSPNIPLDQLWPQWAEEGRLGLVDACFVHRFSFVHHSPRDDLIALLPEDAVSVLDVGCAYGALGRHLKSVKVCHVTGIERNPHMARAAAAFYDAVLTCPVEEARFDRRFDAVVCGDVLEHLMHPSTVLRRLAEAVSDDGVLIASVPNTGHWSVVLDLACGRFETVPAGFLCSTHIRFFTEKDLLLLFDQADWAVEHLERDESPPTPTGCRFIDTLVSAGLGDERSLRTERFRLRARKKRRSGPTGR